MAVKYTFEGKVDNSTVLDYYRKNDVDCFITTSSSEGLPVSIMEAMSFGIPIIATDVGGISELIDGNGVLLNADPSVSEVANAMETMCDSNKAEREALCDNSRRIWEKSFDAEKNAEIFTDRLWTLFKDKDTVVITTNGYPFGGEKSFIEAEIKALIKKYNLIIIAVTENGFDDQYKKKCISELNDICGLGKETNNQLDVFSCVLQWDFLRTLRYAIKYAVNPVIASERKEIISSHQSVIKKVWASIKYYAYSEQFNAWLKKSEVFERLNNETIVYTFWYLYTTLAFCINKEEFNGITVVSRAHGYDLYNERVEKTFRQPFRQIMNSRLEGLFFISQKGYDYYIDTWGRIDSNNMFVSYLGSKGDKNLPYKRSTNKDLLHRVVSCSNLIPLKRVDKIIDALALINRRRKDIDIEWIHFGEGDQMADLSERAKRI